MMSFTDAAISNAPKISVNTRESISPNIVFLGRIYYIIKFCAVFPGLFESAIKNLLCLETLRHGTSMKNVILIKQHGGDPSISAQFKGKKWEKSDNLFYVMTDYHKEITNIIFQIIKRLAPFEYKVDGELFDDENKNSCLSHVKGLLNPTIKFYYQSSEVQRDFKDDPRLSGLGLITSKKVDACRLGIQGALRVGVNKEWKGRVKANPFQAVFGVIQLIVCATLSPLAILSIPILCVGHFTRIDRI